MATNVQPEANANANTNQDSQTENTQVSNETPNSSPPQQATSTPQSTNQATNNDVNPLLTLMQETLRAERDQNEQLRNQLAQQQHNVPVDKEALKARYFDDPVSVMNEQIKQVVEPMLKPLLGFAEQYGRRDTYSMIKDEIRRGPLGPQLADVEPLVDQLIQQSNTQPTLANVQAAVLSAIGAKTAGLWTNPNQSSTQQQPNTAVGQMGNTGTQSFGGGPSGSNPSNIHTNNMIDPPHLRPSNPPAPPANTQANQKRRDYNENERRLMKEMNLSESDYEELLTMPKEKVASWMHEKKAKAANSSGGNK